MRHWTCRPSRASHSSPSYISVEDGEVIGREGEYVCVHKVVVMGKAPEMCA